MRRNGRHPQAGFTLVELLVALAVTAVIAGFIIGGLDLARRAWTISSGRDGAEDIDTAMARLRALVARTMPAIIIDDTDRLARVLFEGGARELTFVTLSEATAFPGGLMRVRLSWQDGAGSAGRSALVLHTAVFRASPRRVAVAEPIVLLRGVTGVSLRYFGVAEAGQPPQWRSDWPGRLGTPRLVRFEVDIADRGATRRRALQVPIRAATAN